MSNIEQIKAFMSMGERPIKRLLVSYFSNFTKDNITKFCESQSINRSKVPKAYIDFAEVIKMMQMMQTLSADTVDRKSIICIPKVPGKMEVTKPNGEKWAIFLGLVDASYVWNPKRINHFAEKQQKLIKHQMGGMMPIGKYVFKCFQHDTPIFKNLTLDLDVPNLNLYITDANFKSLNFSPRVGIHIIKM
jgi:hypothetical protein